MRDKTLVYSGAEVRYRIGDRAEKEALLLLHAAFADGALFEDQVAAFRDDYRLILIDLPGHGDNAGLPSKMSLKHMPEIIESLLADNGIRQVSVVGVSLGGLVAQAFADRYPHRVKSVALVGSYSIHKANESLLAAQKKEGLKWFLYVLLSMNKFKKYVLGVSCHTDRGRALFGKGLGRFGRKSFSSMGGMSSFFRRTDDPMPYPLLIVVGEHDLPLARKAAYELHRLEPSSGFADMAGAGHCANADKPEEFNAIYGRFLSERTKL